MEKVTKLMKELESEIGKLGLEHGNNLIINSGDKSLECDYEYLSMDNLNNEEFMCFELIDNHHDTSESISLTLKDALNLHEHIGKLIKNYLLYDLKLREED